MQKATPLLEEFHMANLKIPQTEAKNEVHWAPPEAPWYKLNANEANFANIQAAGVGVLICDSASRVEVALSKKLSTPLGPLETEAKALEEDVHFSLDVDIHEVILECDSKIVSKAVNDSSVPPVSIGNIIESIRLRLREFRKVQVSHVEQKDNRLAHLLLAHHVKGIDGYAVWIKENHIMIESVLTQDVMFLLFLFSSY